MKEVRSQGSEVNPQITQIDTDFRGWRPRAGKKPSAPHLSRLDSVYSVYSVVQTPEMNHRVHRTHRVQKDQKKKPQITQMNTGLNPPDPSFRCLLSGSYLRHLWLNRFERFGPRSAWNDLRFPLRLLRISNLRSQMHAQCATPSREPDF